MVRIFVIAGFAALLATPLLAKSAFPSIPDSEPGAQITFSKGHEAGFGVSGSQTYSISQNEDCSNIQFLDELAWWTGSTRSIRIAGGHLVYVFAGTNYYYSSLGPTLNVQVNQAECGGGAASFIAEVGHSYNVVEVAPFKGQCTMKVTDALTSEPPASLKMGPFESCALVRNSGGTNKRHQVQDDAGKPQ